MAGFRRPRGRVLLTLWLRHWRATLRSRIAFWVAVLVVGLWVAGSDDLKTPAQALSSAIFIAVLGSLFLAAGVLAREYGSGCMMLDRLHGARALEVALAALAHVSGMSMTIFVLSAVPAIVIEPGWLSWRLAAALSVGAVGMLAWSALLVLLGAVLPGYGNSALAFGLNMISVGAPGIEQSSVPAFVKLPFVIVDRSLPLPGQVTRLVEAFVANGPVPTTPFIVLVASGFLAVILTIRVLDVYEPAMRWQQ
jgi:hypothetical protein